MCMLTVFPMPDLLDRETTERLFNGAAFNNDGHGWAVVIDNQIVTGKSMGADLAIDSFAEAYAKATGPAIFHSRFATHGSETIANVHPFPVRKLPSTYVAHNGILPVEAHPEKGDDRSDTRVFADDILARNYAHLDSPKVRASLDKWLGYNKIAILTTARRFSRQLYVIGLERGEFVDGVWFSNSDHEGYSKYWSAKDRATLSTPEGKEDCIWCHQATVNDLDVCETCGTCQDCWEPYRDCSCYGPTIEQQKAAAEKTSTDLVRWHPPVDPADNDWPTIIGQKS